MPRKSGVKDVIGLRELRFKWSHRSATHRFVTRCINRVLATLPLAVKYASGSILRRYSVPYRLVTDGAVIIQVGAPLDTLHAGRSRGMYLALKSKPGGRAVIVEPDPSSASAFRDAAAQLGLQHVTVLNQGAWHEAGTLRLLVDPSHPATNFTEGCVDYDEDRLADFRSVSIPVAPLDQIVEELGLEQVDLVSITTNGAEREIIRGMKHIIEGGLRYLCLARTGTGYDELAQELGFKLHSVDDRGYTYERA